MVEDHDTSRDALNWVAAVDHGSDYSTAPPRPALVVSPVQASSASAAAVYPAPLARVDAPETAASSSVAEHYSVSLAHVAVASAAASVASTVERVNDGVHVSFYVVVLWSSCHLF